MACLQLSNGVGSDRMQLRAIAIAKWVLPVPVKTASQCRVSGASFVASGVLTRARARRSSGGDISTKKRLSE